MKTLYLDCGMGAAGDMLTAALLELIPDPDGFIDRLNSLGIPGVEIKRERSVKCGIAGTHVAVTVNGEEEGEEHGHHSHHHHHSCLDDIRHIVTEHLRLPEKVAGDVVKVYEMIAEAESRVHGVPVGEIHFHEVGAMDAAADITAVCLLINEIAPDEIVSSPVHVGSGRVKCAHGTLPVPAPATAELLRGVPSYGGSVDGELCTPTGAALLKYFADRFGDMPVMTVDKIGYGMGKNDFEDANCVRAMLGESAGSTDSVLELSCNVDDMTAEEIGFAMERLFEGGAREVYSVPAGMKKSRPGTLLRVICDPRDRDGILKLIFKHTSTIGVREIPTRRYVLDREVKEIDTRFGKVTVKESSGYGVRKRKYEYEDIARIARENGMSLADVKSALENVFDGGTV
ncbi:MAG: nickel pincer cofactor biosynthesis protein LarC [Clostridia bacterium]|nr:nickel pincer cofactor biosynthesis protein LarC [Clostridia bacterium]